MRSKLPVGMTRALALPQYPIANKEVSKTRGLFSSPIRIMLHTRWQDLIDVRRSSVRRSRSGYQACVHAHACKDLRLRTNQLLQRRGFNDPACDRPVLLWLRSCTPHHPRLVRMPHSFSTNGNISRLPSSDHVPLRCNPPLPHGPRMRHSTYGTQQDLNQPARLPQSEVDGP